MKHHLWRPLFLRFLWIVTIPLCFTYAQTIQSVRENARVQNLAQDRQRQVALEFKNLKDTANRAPPTVTARLIREAIGKYKLDANYRQELPRGLDPLQVEVNQTLFRAGDGLQKSIEQRVSEGEGEKVPELRKRIAEEPIEVLIQLSRNISLNERLALLDLDVSLYAEKGLTVIAQLPLGAIRSVVSMAFVRWIGEFDAAFKYHEANPVSMKKSVFIYPLDHGTQEHEKDLESFGLRVEKYYPRENVYVVETNESRFPQIAQLWWVRWIEREPMEQMHGVYFEPGDSRQLISADKTSFDGNGVRIGVHDNGLWNGNTVDFPNGSIFTLGTFGGTNDPHGTHVTGIIAARGREATYKGVAPASTIYFAPGVGGNQGFSYLDAFNYLNGNGVIASNHSWGWDKNYSYDDDTKNIDGYADDGKIIIVSAANDGPLSQTIGNPATGKNVISVGAIYYVKNNGSNHGIGDVANYSSRGPTRGDYRLKPDIVAPGGDPSWSEGVVSTNRNPWEIRDSHNNIVLQGSIGDGINNFPEWPDNDWYIRLSGTSMAAPHITGVAAKALQWDPSLRSHTFKAALINTAIPIKANTTAQLSGYANTNVGYGLANAFSITNHYTGEEQDLLFVGDGYTTILNTENKYTISVPSGAKKLCVTMAYDDQEGTTSASSHIIDNLDLYLSSPTTDYKYQKPAGVSGESPVEKIVIENPVSGSWTMKVKFVNPGLFSSQVFAVHARAILKTPALSVSASPSIIYKGRAQSLDITPTVTNTGGYIAAGVNVEMSSSPSGFSGEINTNKYVDNLMYQNASASQTFKLTTPTTDGSYTLNIIASGINLGLSDASASQTVIVDGAPPQAPISLAATPSGWTNTNSFSINWINPADLSGVVAAWYKLGSPPTSGSDGTRSTNKPFTVSATVSGGQVIYVWLEDRVGNKDHNNRASTTLYYTGTVTLINVTASLSPSTATPSQAVLVSGRAIYNTGSPVTSGTVTIAIIGGSSWTTTLDANGNFSRLINAPSSAGNYTVRSTVSDGSTSSFIDNSLSVSAGGVNPSAYQFDHATVCENVQSVDPFEPVNETRWIRSTFARVNVWVRLNDLYKPVRVKWEWYKPDGTLWNTTYSDWTSDPQASGYLYWYWWKFWSNWTVSGTELADMEGKWSAKIFVQESGGSFRYHDTQYFTIRYNFTEHQMAKDVQSSDPYLPINPTNTFTQSDTKALTWMNLDDVSEGLEVRWDYFEPNGSLYATFSYTVPDPGSGHYYPWCRAWGWIGVANNAAASKTGDWKVDVLIKDPFNNFDREYTDYFRILESPDAPPTISLSSPGSALEGTTVAIPVSVTDNGYLRKVELFWTDQSEHSVVLADNILKGSFSTTYTIGPYIEGTIIHHAVRAYDVVGNVAESPDRTITILDSDTLGPQISNLRIEEYDGNGDGVIQDHEQVRVSWDASDTSGISSVDLTVDCDPKPVVSNAYSISGPYFAGVHQLRIVATDNDLSPASTIQTTTFVVTETAPPAPVPVSPPNGSTGVSTNLMLLWYRATGAARYQLQLSSDSQFVGLVVNDSTLTDTTRQIGPLENSTRYYWRVNATNGGGTSGWSLPPWSFTTQGVHNVIVPQGWNMISSFVVPKDSTLDSVFVKIKPHMVIAKNGGGKVYWPALTINTIGKWRSKDGYQLYMQSTDTLTINGDEINPQQVPLIMSQGWSLVSYLRNSPMRSDSAVTTLGGSLVIAKNGAGQVYWPALSINTIGNMKPGQGYQMYLSSGATLTYPANAASSLPSVLTKTGAVAQTQQEMIPARYKVEKTETGSNATLVVKGTDLKDGDEVGVRGGDGKLIGSGVVQSNRAVIAVWGDNVLTDQEKEGAAEGESLALTVWSKSGNKEKPVAITSLTDGLTQQKKPNILTYATDGVWEVEIGEVKEIPTVFSLEQNYPNPFNPSTVIKYGIPKDVRVRLEVYNILGQKLVTLVDEDQKAGYYDVVFDARSLSSGVYFYMLNSGEFRQTKKLMLLR